MTLQECYTALHGNYTEALTRLMNETLMNRFLLKFPHDPSMQTLLDKVSEEDWAEAFHAVHTLKGVAANMAFTELYEAASALTEQLRDQQSPCNLQLLEKVKSAYQLVINTIQTYMA